MLLRYNSTMRGWYKFYCNRYDNTIGENAFAMDLSIYWKFLKDLKILDSNLTFSSINRVFFNGPKNIF